jgi:hypothetical protein
MGTHMLTRSILSLASMFLGAAVACGQIPYVPPGLTSEPRPAPVSPALPSYAPEAAPAHATGCDSASKPCFGAESGPGTTGVVSFDAEYVLWFLANSRTSISAARSSLLPQSGSLPFELGDAEHAKNEPFSGGRFKLGYWQVEPNPGVPGGIRDLGIEACLFAVGQRAVDLRNDTSPTLVRPFFDANNRQDSGFLVAAPGVATGGISATARVTDLWGAEANVWKNIYYDSPGTVCSLSVMSGLRYLSADNGLQINSISDFSPTLAPTSPFFPLAGNSLAITDSFATHNRFYGGQIGITGNLWPCPAVQIDVGFKLALGVTHEELNIFGSQLRTFASGQTQAFNGGVLAQPSNSGSFTQNKFAQAPEVNCKVNWWASDHVTFSVGFSALFWSRIARAATQIDPEVNITQIPNFPVPAGTPPSSLVHPSVSFHQSDLWFLGLSLGAEFVW